MQKTSTIYQEKTGFGERLETTKNTKGVLSKGYCLKIRSSFHNNMVVMKEEMLMPPADNLRILAGML